MLFLCHINVTIHKNGGVLWRGGGVGFVSSASMVLRKVRIAKCRLKFLKPQKLHCLALPIISKLSKIAYLAIVICTSRGLILGEIQDGCYEGRSY